jgi:hypothetical protein
MAGHIGLASSCGKEYTELQILGFEQELTEETECAHQAVLTCSLLLCFLMFNKNLAVGL